MDRKIGVVAALIAMLLATGIARAAEGDGPLKTQKDKESYVVGLLVAEDLKGQGLELNTDTLMLGLKDGLAGSKPLLTQEQAVETMDNLRKAQAAKREAVMKEVADKNKKESEVFLAENKKKEGVKTTDSGLQYKVLQEGKGMKPTPTDKVTVHYRGAFIDGTEFDNSFKRGEAAVLPVGGVIKGWTEALQLMKTGSKWQVFVPPELGYGEAGASPVVPPNVVLVFDVELLSIVTGEKTEAKDK